MLCVKERGATTPRERKKPPPAGGGGRFCLKTLDLISGLGGVRQLFDHLDELIKGYF